MTGARHIAKVGPGAFDAQAGPLIEATYGAVLGYPVSEERLRQVALSMAMQACVNAACNGEITTADILQAFASAFASWLARVTESAEEVEDALIAFRATFDRASAAISGAA